MRLVQLGIHTDLPTVVVLGAGASRGASCVHLNGVQPPTDADFFAQAQRLPPSQLTKSDNDLFGFMREEFGHSNMPTLEVFFTQIAAVERFHRQFHIRGRPSGRFARQLVALRELIPRVFAAALSNRNCVWHERIAFALRSNDGVMSFNYDTLIDRALQAAGSKRWDPTVGYGFEVASGTQEWAPTPSPGKPVKYPVQLIKPHGSLNWEIDDGQQAVHLVDEYSLTSAQSIIPPTWDKTNVDEWPWSAVWRSARRLLGPARMVVVIGYSVPPTDQMSQALLRADVSDLDALVVVNPDEAARRRIIDTMASALSSKTTTIELSTLKEFATHLPKAPSEESGVTLEKQLENIGQQISELVESLDELTDTTEEIRMQHQDLDDQVTDLASHVGELGVGDIANEVAELRGALHDLDVRIDSPSY